MKVKMGEVLLILGIALLVIGEICFVTGFLPRNIIPTMGALALIFVGGGASMKRRMDMSKLGWLGILGLLGLVGVVLDDPRWFGLYGLYGLFALFVLKKK